MTPITDWNWFFSSLSQSGAALIGIIAAFIISKLLSENEKKDRLIQVIQSNIIQFRDLRTKLSKRRFEFCNFHVLTHSVRFKKAIVNGEFKGQDDSGVIELINKIYPKLYISESVIVQIKRRLAAIGDIGDPVRIEMIRTANESHEDEYPQEFYDEYYKIEALYEECKVLREKFRISQYESNFLSNNLKPIMIIIILLMIGFLASVVYPLHFMPFANNSDPSVVISFHVLWDNVKSIQGIHLILLSIIIEGIFVYFIILISSIRQGYKQASKNIKEEYLTLTGYSEYFKYKDFD